MPYDSTKLKQLMEELVGPLFVHVKGSFLPRSCTPNLPIGQLKAEVGYLQPENVRKTGLSPHKVQMMFLTAGQHMDGSGMRRYVD